MPTDRPIHQNRQPAKTAYDNVLQQIAEALMKETDMTLPVLMKGNAGVALFFAYYYLYTKEESYLLKCHELTENALGYMEKIDMPAMFASGFPGITWLLKHLVNLGIYPENTDGEVESIDAYVYQALPAYLESRKADLFYGYTGLGIYFLERNTVHQAGAVNMMLARLEQDATETGDAVYWHEDGAAGINLGLAHGIAGTLKFICHAAARYPLSGNLKRLAQKSGVWLTKQANQTSGISLFPNSITPGNKKYADSRLAWCYGDLGISLTLLTLAAQPGCSKLNGFNDTLLSHLSGRPFNTSFVKYDEELKSFDTGLCHGIAGITYLYRKIYEKTGHKGIGQKCEEWMAVMLQNVQATLDALKHIPKRKDIILNQLVSSEDYNLIHGISGAGLVLLGLQERRLGGWDHIFLMN